MPLARPRLPRLVAASTAVILGLGVLAGCSSESDVSKATFAQELAERTGRSEAVAQCLTDAIWEEFDQGDRNRIYRAASDQELTDDERATLKEINDACLAEDATAPTQPAPEGE